MDRLVDLAGTGTGEFRAGCSRGVWTPRLLHDDERTYRCDQSRERLDAAPGFYFAVELGFRDFSGSAYRTTSVCQRNAPRDEDDAGPGSPFMCPLPAPI